MANLPATNMVGIRCTAIPDGIVPAQDKQPAKARLSLVLTPDTGAAADKPPYFDVSKWPEAIAMLAGQGCLRIYLGKSDGTTTLLNHKFSSTDAVVRDATKANDLWKTIFSKPKNAFESLHEALDETVLQKAKTNSKPIPDGPIIRGRMISVGDLNWVQKRYLNEAFNAFHDDSQFVRLLALLTAAAMNGNFKVPPNLVAMAGDILGDEASNWIGSIAQEFSDRPFRQKMLPSLQHAVRGQLMDAGLGNQPNDAFGLLKRLGPLQPPSREGATLDGDRTVAIEGMLSGALGNPRKKPIGPPSKSGFVQDPGMGQEMMRELFKVSALQHRKGTDVKDLAKGLGAYQMQAAKNIEAFHRHWRNVPIGKKLDKDALKQLEVDAARRKFFGIRALPTLAKFLRLTVDVVLDADPAGYDWIGAMFVGSKDDMSPYGNPGHTPDVTAFEFGENAFFRPRSCPRPKDQATDLDSTPQVTGGVVNLRDPRFSISILDLPSSLNSMRLSAEQQTGAQRDGTLLDTISTRTTERQSRGLQLIDHMAPDLVASDLVRFRYTTSTKPPPRPGTPERPFFAEDLVIGYRPYIRRSKRGIDHRPFPWRSLVARKVDIADIAPYVRGRDYDDVRMRDHGYVRPAHRTQDGGSTTLPPDDPAAPPAAPISVPTAIPTTDGQMFAWMGSSLGLSTDLRQYVAVKDADTAPGQNPYTDLSLDIVYSFSNAADDRLPALRVGDGYLLGLSPVYPNGGGPTYKDAADTFANNPVTLGHSSGGGMAPFVFGPPRDISVPALLVSQAEAEQWAKAETIKPRRGNAEHVARIVLRSATKPQNDKDNVKRYLVPPRASFEVAEQWGMFDGDYDATPAGAFADYKLDPTLGSFLVYPPRPTVDPHGKKIKPVAEQQARSAVLQPVSGSHQPTARYYPDPLARNLKAAFEREGATPAGFPDDIPLHAFWKQSASPITAKPIELLIKRWVDAREGGQIDFSDNSAKITGAGASRTLDRLSIQVAPAEEIDLRFWCVPDRYDLLRGHQALRSLVQKFASEIALQDPANKVIDRHTLDTCIAYLTQGETLKDIAGQSAFKGLTGPQKDFLDTVDGIFDIVLAALTLRTPDNGLNAWLTIEVVHAVEKPLAVPAIQCRPWEPAKLVIQPVRVQRNAVWADYLKDAGIGPSDLLEKVLGLQSQENSSTTYFVGQLDFDRASTGELRIEASWPETDPASAIRKIKPPAVAAAAKDHKRYKFDPPVKDRVMFSVKPPRDKGLNPEGKLDLTFDETGLPRGLDYPFDDTTAREISLRLVGVSRFASDFPDETSPPALPDALGRFEVESRPPIGSSRLAHAGSETYRTYNVIVPASTPPVAAAVSRLEWVMPETLTEFARGRRVCIEKNFYPRLYLGQDWCRFGELLAVLCAPGNLVSDRPYSPDAVAPAPTSPVPLSLSEILEAPSQRSIEASYFAKGGAAFQIAESVSRWGADPTTSSGALTGTITRERFSGFVATKPDVAISATNFTPVAVLLYKPQFDCDTGEFYVDIGIDPGPAHSPIVQLAIARYQTHVIDPKFHLSTITQVRPFQIAPKRKVEVLIRDDRHITTIVQGVGYIDRNIEIPQSFGAAGGSAPPSNSPSLPQYRYPLQNVRVIGLKDDHSTTGIQVHNVDGQPLAVKHLAPQFYHPKLIWISEFKLPLSSSKYHYGLQIEEVDLHFADEAYEAGALAGSHIVERLSNFSLTVDLDHGLYTPNAEF